MGMRSLIVALLIACFTTFAVRAQQCVVEISSCADAREGELCFAGGTVEVAQRITDTAFAQPGDSLALVDAESLTVGEDGAAVAELQGIRAVAFGEVEITNDVPYLVTLPITFTVSGRLRGGPSTNDDILNVVPVGTRLTAVARDESATWVYTEFNGAGGWVSTEVVNVEGNVIELMVYEADSPALQPPMQAFSLATENASGCAGGVLLQNAPDSPFTEVTINEVLLSVRGTIYARTVDESLEVYTLNGSALMTMGEEIVAVPAGTFAQITAGESVSPQPYDPEVVATLPLNVLAQPVTAANPLPEEAIEAAVQSEWSGIGLLPGTYAITRVEATAVNTSFGCPADATFNLSHDGSLDRLFGQYALVSEGVYGASESALDSHRTPSESYNGDGIQFTITGPVSISALHVSNGSGDAGWCEFRYEGTRVGE